MVEILEFWSQPLVGLHPHVAAYPNRTCLLALKVFHALALTRNEAHTEVSGSSLVSLLRRESDPLRPQCRISDRLPEPSRVLVEERCVFRLSGIDTGGCVRGRASDQGLPNPRAYRIDGIRISWSG